MVRPRKTPAAGLRPSKIAAAMQAAARKARTEEDLRIGVENALRPVRDALGISPYYERTYSPTVAVLSGGSSDAVYGHAIIEHKRPEETALMSNLMLRRL